MSRSRRKLDTSPIEYDDVVGSPSLKGMVSFLEIPPGELPHLDFTDKGIPPSPPPEPGAPATGAPDATVHASPPLPRGIPRSPAPEPGGPQAGAPAAADIATRPPAPGPRPLALGGTPLSPAPESHGPETGAPAAADITNPAPAPWPLAPAYPPLLVRPLARVRRATLAQDGHSFGEQALYDALWQHAHPYEGDTRIITIGYRRMAELARLTVNNCKANIQSLLQKLAVEEVAGFTHSQGRTYLVFNNAAIVQRRRQAGLTHYIRSRGVVFVDPDTSQPLTARIRDKSGAPFSAAPPAGAP